jgi:hypothetical protein
LIVDRVRHLPDSTLKAQTVDWLEDLRERKLEGLLQTCAMLPEIDEDSDKVVATGCDPGARRV